MSKMLDKLLVDKTYVVGVFDDDDTMMGALKKLKERNFVAKDAFIPFPVHGIDQALNMKRSRIGYAALAFGLLGGGLAILMQVYMMHWSFWDWNIGGKPTLPIPSFIPITFELTILISALGMATVYFMRSHLVPGLEPKLFDSRQTSDRFVVIYEVEPNAREEVKNMLSENQAIEVREDTVKESKTGMPLPFNY